MDSDLSSEPPSGASNWEIYKDAFAPPPPRQRVKAWERAPVAAHAPRLQGQKIWKKLNTNYDSRQRDDEFHESVETELLQGGMGARKKPRTVSGKENIGPALWKDGLLAKDVKDPQTNPSVSPKKQRSSLLAGDLDALLVPRKRTNSNHLITPRKHTRKTFLNQRESVNIQPSATQSVLVPLNDEAKILDIEEPATTQNLSPHDLIKRQDAATTPKDMVPNPTWRRKSLRGNTRRLTCDANTEKVLFLAAEHITTNILGSDVGSGITSQESAASSKKSKSFGLNEVNLGQCQDSDPATLVSAPDTALDEEEAAQKKEPNGLIGEQPLQNKRSQEILEGLGSQSLEEIREEGYGKPDQLASSDVRNLAVAKVQSSQTPSPPIRLPPAAVESSTKHEVASPVKSRSTPQRTRKTPQKRRSTRRSTRTQSSSIQPENQTIEQPEMIERGSVEVSYFSSSPKKLQSNELPFAIITGPDLAEGIGASKDSEIRTGFGQNGSFAQTDTVQLERQGTPFSPNQEACITAEKENLQVLHLDESAGVPRSENSENSTNPNLQEDIRAATFLTSVLETSAVHHAPISEMISEGSKSPDLEQPVSGETAVSRLTAEKDFDLSTTITKLLLPISAAQSLSVQELEQTSAETVLESIVDDSLEEVPEISTPDQAAAGVVEAISETTTAASYDDDDTDMLRNFLTRVKANKAAKASKSAPKRKRSLPHSPLQLPLGGDDANISPSSLKAKDEFDVSLPSTSPSKRNLDGSCPEEDTSGSGSVRRSGRTRLPVKAAPLAAPSFIPVRRLGQDLDNTVTLRRNEEKELAALTRVNTRKNKGGSLFPAEVLAKKAEEKDDPACRQRALKEVFDEKMKREKKGKRVKVVAWAEEIAQFQRSESKNSETEKEKEKVPAEEKKSSVKVGMRSKMSLGMAVNGTPVSKRRMRSRA